MAVCLPHGCDYGDYTHNGIMFRSCMDFQLVISGSDPGICALVSEEGSVAVCTLLSAILVLYAALVDVGV